MKKTVRYEVRWRGEELLAITDNLFEAYEKKDYYDKFGSPVTIHEITTTEKDITETAKIEKDGKI